ncbi:MAG: hypothetical protein DDT23_01119 [candidate division WS2 bacterium]|nr:hypothetical protein [Candidatus Lithacetigena glycinireducens]
MKDLLISLIPFVLTTQSKIHMNWSRILEAVIIALIGGAMAGYIAVRELTVKFEMLNKQVTAIENRVERIENLFITERNNK